MEERERKIQKNEIQKTEEEEAEESGEFVSGSIFEPTGDDVWLVVTGPTVSLTWSTLQPAELWRSRLLDDRYICTNLHK